MHQIIAAYPLATLISGYQDTADVSLVPLMIDKRQDGRTILTGHVDRNNPHASRLHPGENVAFVFNGPDSYASPDLYADSQLPGWLYVTVKGVGAISRSIQGDDAIEMLCEASTRFGGSKQQFALEKGDPRFSMFINAIVGFEIEVSEISGIAKLAQDKGPIHANLACGHLATSANPHLPELLDQMLDCTA